MLTQKKKHRPVTKNSPRSPPKGEAAIRSAQIDKDVDAAHENFKALQKKLEVLIAAMKGMHGSMVQFNTNRFKTFEQMQTFAAGTPLTEVFLGHEATSGSSGRSRTPSSFASPIQPLPHFAGEQEKDSASTEQATVSDCGDSFARETKHDFSEKKADKFETVSDKSDTEKKVEAKGQELRKEEETNTYETESDSSISEHEGMQEKAIESADDSSSDGKKNEKLWNTSQKDDTGGSTEERPQSPSHSQAENHPDETGDDMEPVVIGKCEAPPVNDKNLSYASVHHSAQELATIHENWYKQIIDYAEEWLEVTSSRIAANLILFGTLRDSVDHFTKKMDELNGSVAKVDGKGNNKSVISKQSAKLNRNVLKLRGAREAHDNCGEDLFLLMDEITTRAWRDFYALLLKAMQFEANYNSANAATFGKLEIIVLALKDVGACYDVDPNGRLDVLKACHPEEFYLGNREVRTAKKRGNLSYRR